MKRTVMLAALVLGSTALFGCTSNNMDSQAEMLSNKIDQLSSKVDQLASDQAMMKKDIQDAKAAAESASMEARRANQRIDNMSSTYYKK
ncbi:Lpp/OprI family alanine-zipper lipoprotein [Gallaecimonas xiamenensis]|uniref:Major outer membrane lipoprotein Lpp n=1 Tax=Gallaecimonas xiamenensis 3-C-1 TaxID=745411 RepID=K2IUG9_9GAMM|nr:Lpp/OprI family alanine-zipper lipoprotein [Gallaecimonas xiamenensis]EKE73946.1 lipoprotein [Gallaecimonas xiamenensis 3-C-1]